jgi:hypothetical protein
LFNTLVDPNCPYPTITVTKRKRNRKEEITKLGRTYSLDNNTLWKTLNSGISTRDEVTFIGIG